METIYSVEQNRKMLIYHVNEQIYLQTMRGFQIGRPLALCNDFLSSLTSTIHNGTIYYAYINREHALLVKSITEPSTLYRLDVMDSSAYYHPHVIVFHKQLLLFYILKNPLENSYSVKCVSPFQNNLALIIPDAFPILPQLDFISTKDTLLIRIYSDFFHKTLQVDTSFQSISLGSKQDFTEEQTTHHQNQVREFEHTIHDLEQQLSNVKFRLSEKENELRKQHQLTEQMQNINAMLAEKENEIQNIHTILSEKENKIQNIHTILVEKENRIQSQNQLIESIKKQYEELMDVASKYRDEAIKWRNKFYVE